MFQFPSNGKALADYELVPTDRRAARRQSTESWDALCLSGTDNVALLQSFDFLCEGFNLIFKSLLFSAPPVC